MFVADSFGGSRFLKALYDRVVRADLSALANAGGFEPPNNFEFQRILDPIRAGKFPDGDFYEYLWAIYECGYEAIAGLARWPRLYVASLYLYCNKRKQWSINVESDYYYMILLGELEQGVSDCSIVFLKFLEWLFECVPPDDGYDDYFLLLSWMLLKRLRGDADEKIYYDVMRDLLARDLSRDRIRMLTVSDRDGSAWLDLHQRIPLRYQFSSKDYERVICGGNGSTD